MIIVSHWLSVTDQVKRVCRAVQHFFRQRISRYVQNFVRQRAPFKCMGFWYIRSIISAKSERFGLNSPLLCYCFSGLPLKCIKIAERWWVRLVCVSMRGEISACECVVRAYMRVHGRLLVCAAAIWKRIQHALFTYSQKSIKPEMNHSGIWNFSIFTGFSHGCNFYNNEHILIKISSIERIICPNAINYTK